MHRLEEAQLCALSTYKYSLFPVISTKCVFMLLNFIFCTTDLHHVSRVSVTTLA